MMKYTIGIDISKKKFLFFLFCYNYVMSILDWMI